MRFTSSVSSLGDEHATSYGAVQNGRDGVEGLRWAKEQIRSLGQALALVPSESGLDRAVGFRVVVEGRPRLLKAPVQDEIFGIVREAIVNAYRHSGAGKIDIDIEYQHAGLSVTVRDNGCGIDPRSLRWGADASSGLQRMRERAGQIDARLRILSGVGRGTEIELRVPEQIVFERR